MAQKIIHRVMVDDLAVGQRVCGGLGEDYDEGTVVERHDGGRRVGEAYVAWDSGVSSWTPVSELRPL